MVFIKSFYCYFHLVYGYCTSVVTGVFTTKCMLVSFIVVCSLELALLVPGTSFVVYLQYSVFWLIAFVRRN